MRAAVHDTRRDLARAHGLGLRKPRVFRLVKVEVDDAIGVAPPIAILSM